MSTRRLVMSVLSARSIGLSPSTLRTWDKHVVQLLRMSLTASVSSMLMAMWSTVQFSLFRAARSAPEDEEEPTGPRTHIT